MLIKWLKLKAIDYVINLYRKNRQLCIDRGYPIGVAQEYDKTIISLNCLYIAIKYDQ